MSNNFDVILVSNGEIVNPSSGVTEYQYQAMTLPLGKGSHFGVRVRQSYTGARWGGWTFGDPTRPSAGGDPLSIIDYLGHAEAGDYDANSSGWHAPRYDGTLEPLVSSWAWKDKTVRVQHRGFTIASHDELSQIDTGAGEVAKTLSARLGKVFAAQPIGKRGPNEDEIADWHAASGATFIVSRWSHGVYPTRPNGAYTYAPFTGNVSAPAPAGEKVSVEKRTFETTYTRPNGQTYYSRNIGEHSDVDVLVKCREAGVNVLAYGPPGTGKTAMYEAAFGEDLITVLGTAETEVSDFVGSYTQRPGEGYVWVDGPLVKAMEQGKAMLIDEIGLVDPKVLSIVYSVMDGRGELNVTQNPDRGTVHAAEGFYIVAATNPDAPGVVLSEALLSRFTVQVEVDSDYELARHLKVNKKVVRAAETLDKKRRAGEILWAPQLRELFAVKSNTDLFGEAFALRSLIASSPDLDRETVCDVLSKATGETLTPLRMEG